MSIFNKGGGISAPNPGGGGSSGSKIKGVDVYHEDDVNSWSQVLNAGYQFAICKASQGLGGDSAFVRYFEGAKAAGLIVGGYHFLNYNESGASQARVFANMLKSAGFNSGDLTPVLDWEYADGHDPTSSEIAIVRDALAEIQQLTGRNPMIYCSNYLPNSIGNPAWFRAHPLWVARYGANPTVSWNFWQYSESASIAGIGNSADANYFSGSLADLRNFVSQY